MVLEDYRKRVDPILKRLAKCMIKINPNTLTIVAFIWAILACISFLLLCRIFGDVFLLLAGVFIFLNGLFDVLDGKVAKLTKKTSLKGDYLEHVIDRYADLLIIIGIAFSPYCNTIVGLLAFIGIFFASYMGTQAQAVGVGRRYKGLLSRADRITILIFASFIQYALLHYSWEYFTIPGWGYNLTLMEIVMIYFVIMGHVTAIQRICYTWKELGKKRKKN